MIPAGKRTATSRITLAPRLRREDDALQRACDRSRILPTPKEATMELTPLQTTPRSVFAPRSVQHVLIRANGPLFYSLASASLLEADMPLAADRLLYFFGGD